MYNIVIDGKPLDELPTSKLAEIVRYKKADARTLAIIQTELWRREAGLGGTRAPEDAEEVNRLLAESKRR